MIAFFFHVPLLQRSCKSLPFSHNIPSSHLRSLTACRIVPSASYASQAIGMEMPNVLYGTAWKGNETKILVSAAIEAGFRGIDTAGQPKHYAEELVGEGWVEGAKKAGITRKDLFIQTKFTPISGHTRSKPLPYDPNAPLETQVSQSIANSLKNLQTDYVDCFIMHSPLPTLNATLQVWRAFEDHVKKNVVHHIGVSNCYDMATFRSLYEAAEIKPSVLQNRFYNESGFDVELRAFCHQKDIKYQSFWTLSANWAQLRSSEMREIAANLKLTPAQTMYAFVRSLGIVPLNGTTSATHMIQDLAVIEAAGKDGHGVVHDELQKRIAKTIGVAVE